MAGYRQGRDIAESFLTLIEQDDPKPVGERIADFLARERDPRLAEIVRRLEAICVGAAGGAPA